MDKETARKNSEVYFEVNMLRFLFKGEFLDAEEYARILGLVLDDNGDIILTE